MPLSDMTRESYVVKLREISSGEINRGAPILSTSIHTLQLILYSTPSLHHRSLTWEFEQSSYTRYPPSSKLTPRLVKQGEEI